MTDKQPKHVFISYVRENQDQVDRLVRDLESHDVNVWLDRNSIKPGARWKAAIQEAIRQGNFFIACFSDEYTSKSKTYMNEELTLAPRSLGNTLLTANGSSRCFSLNATSQLEASAPERRCLILIGYLFMKIGPPESKEYCL